ncbi:hypothetical protein D4764_19G0003290 [Takifugu flavidus]|uniref:Uncharacterized protein n=1 Tax=Takifugu flavidus TaxID=433684 RepID=A0A5C6NPK5_9TELE|nr:hypothetical protein D4764_19G0003290 [Takifugu flavidus]
MDKCENNEGSGTVDNSIKEDRDEVYALVLRCKVYLSKQLQDVQAGRSKQDVPSGTSTLQGLSGVEVTDPSSPELLSEPDHRQGNAQSDTVEMYHLQRLLLEWWWWLQKKRRDKLE